MAEYADDRSQLAHSLSFRAYTAGQSGDLNKAVQLTDAAIGVIGAHPILRVYDSYQRAELLAASRDSFHAYRALHKADAAAEATAGLAKLGRWTEARREAEQGVAVMPADHQSAGWLTRMLEQIEH